LVDKGEIEIEKLYEVILAEDPENTFSKIKIKRPQDFNDEKD
jgi:hypothetical protein